MVDTTRRVSFAPNGRVKMSISAKDVGQNATPDGMTKTNVTVWSPPIFTNRKFPGPLCIICVKDLAEKVKEVRRNFMTGPQKWTRKDLVAHTAQALDHPSGRSMSEDIAGALSSTACIKILLITGYIE